MLWVLYLAVEPWLRRTAPHLVVSWSRLLAGHWRDPMVGRDVLLGTAMGLVHTFAIYLGALAPGLATGQPPPPVTGLTIQVLVSVRTFLGYLVRAVLVASPAWGLVVTTAYLLLLLALRRRWLATIALWMIIALLPALLFITEWWSLVAPVILATALTVTVTRLGLLATVAWYGSFLLSYTFPLAFSGGVWYGGYSFITAAMIVGLTVMAARMAVGHVRAAATDRHGIMDP